MHKHKNRKKKLRLLFVRTFLLFFLFFLTSNIMGNNRSKNENVDVSETKKKKVPKKNMLKEFFGKDSAKVITGYVFAVLLTIVGFATTIISSISYADSVSNENIIENASNTTISDLIDRDISLGKTYTCEKDKDTGENVLTFVGSLDLDFLTIPGNPKVNPANTITRFDKGANFNNIIYSAVNPLSNTRPETLVTSDINYYSGTFTPATSFFITPTIDSVVPQPTVESLSTMKLKLYDNSVTSVSIRCPVDESDKSLARLYMVWDSEFSAFFNSIATEPTSCEDVGNNPEAYTGEQAYQACGWRIALCIPNPFRSNEYVEMTGAKLPITY